MHVAIMTNRIFIGNLAGMLLLSRYPKPYLRGQIYSVYINSVNDLTCRRVETIGFTLVMKSFARDSNKCSSLCVSTSTGLSSSHSKRSEFNFTLATGSSLTSCRNKTKGRRTVFVRPIAGRRVPSKIVLQSFWFSSPRAVAWAVAPGKVAAAAVFLRATKRRPARPNRRRSVARKNPNRTAEENDRTRSLASPIVNQSRFSAT